MEDNKLLGPYRATKLWNEAISIFRNGMPLKRHRKHIKLYDNCFTGAEAVNWLQYTLQQNPNFGHDVTREKTAQLLNKFFKVGVFQNISSGSSDNLGNFKENELYQFCCRSPLRNMKISALASINNQNLQKNKLLARSTSKCSSISKLPKRSPSFQTNFIEEVKSKAASNQLKQMEIEEVWKTVVLGRFQALLGTLNVEDILPSNQTSGLWIMKNANTVNGQPSDSINHSQLFPRWILAAMKSLIDWPHLSGTASCSFQYSGFERDVFKVIKDYFSNLELPLITCFLYSTFINAYAYVEYLESMQESVSYNEIGFQNVNCEIPSRSLENLVLNMTSSVKESHSRPQSVCSSVQTGNITKSFKASSIASVNVSKDCSSNKSVVGSTILAGCGDNLRNYSDSVDDLQFVNANKLFSSTLPPNSCFETAFTSESPVTRIIPRKLVENIHLSHKNRCSRSIFRNPSFAASNASSQHPVNVKVSPKSNLPCKIKRNSSAPNLIDSKNYINDNEQTASITKNAMSSASNDSLNARDNFNVDSAATTCHTTYSSIPKNTYTLPSSVNKNKPKKLGPDVQEQHSKRRRKKMVSENVSNNKLHHVRNKSGGYVNLAMSCSVDELSRSEGFDHLVGETLDYDAALETLQKLMKCTAKFRESEDISETKVICDELQNQSCSSASSIWSYHTAASGDHSCQEQTPGNTSCFQLNEYKNWTSDALMNSGVQTLQGQQLGINVLQILLLLLPPVNRYKLHLLLYFMSNITDNGRLVLQDGICTKSLLLDTFTSSILQPELSDHGNESIARRLVGFMLDNHEALFQTPSGLKAEVDSHIAEMHLQDEYTSSLRVPVTYCEQISCQQYEQQRLTGSQLALTELLEQIIVDTKMSSKEKKKRLKMFKEAYPHIYFRRFPCFRKEERDRESKPKGILRFTSLSRLRNLRI